MKGGEIVQVEGGHILRSTGRKDRHSKVYTLKGPRDRRVRLSAHTAIQFYDVQDRLGYDRPSKAVDWLIKKAKTAIDKLNEPPPPPPPPNDIQHTPTTDSNPSSSELALDQQSETPSGYAMIQANSAPGCSNPSIFLAPPDTHFMKSFFPTTSFPGFGNESVSRASFQAEDLGLSLHSFQADNQGNSNNQVLPFQENFQSWSGGGDMDSRVGSILMNSLGNLQQPMFSQSSFSNRELLQSNLAVTPWNQRPLDQRGKSPDFELGFHVPARICGDEEPDHHRS